MAMIIDPFFIALTILSFRACSVLRLHSVVIEPRLPLQVWFQNRRAKFRRQEKLEASTHSRNLQEVLHPGRPLAFPPSSPGCLLSPQLPAGSPLFDSSAAAWLQSATALASFRLAPPLLTPSSLSLGLFGVPSSSAETPSTGYLTSGSPSGVLPPAPSLN